MDLETILLSGFMFYKAAFSDDTWDSWAFLAFGVSVFFAGLLINLGVIPC